jgi:hypothetical protein
LLGCYMCTFSQNMRNNNRKHMSHFPYA